jgi:HSP20 family protein
MPKEKRSFFEKLTGSVSLDEEEDEELLEDDEYEQQRPQQQAAYEQEYAGDEEYEWEEPEGQLGVDVYHTAETLVIKAIVAGVSPEDLDVSITRDMVTIRGRREERQEVDNEDYFYKELYWGNFSRTIVLPQEIEVEEAEANEKHGLLVITLPKVDKEKQTKLKVKAS